MYINNYKSVCCGDVVYQLFKYISKVSDSEILVTTKVHGKNKLLYKVAEASIEKPEGKVKEVIYPVAPEQTLRDLVQEFKLGGSYEQKVQTVMRGSYSHHYRRMVPFILKTLLFCATNETSKPIIAALELIGKYADKTMITYPETEKVPLDNVVPEDWLEAVKQGQRVNRINYELCVLKVLREKLRCKKSPSGDLTFDGVQNTYLISPVLGSYASP